MIYDLHIDMPEDNHSMAETRRFQCSKCEKSYKKIGDLNAHDATKHCGVKVCCSFCTGSFVTDANLKRHIKQYHSGKLRYQCKDCNELFGTKSEQDVHFGQCEARPLRCKQCPFKCKSSSGLWNHVFKIHRKEDQKKCKTKYKGLSASDCQHHAQTFHPMLTHAPPAAPSSFHFPMILEAPENHGYNWNYNQFGNEEATNLFDEFFEQPNQNGDVAQSPTISEGNVEQEFVYSWESV
ncbi:unnamed protein product [Caenorhabditis sp. 36 PRJEB53466]|nr:unnamed protein product [Caenorhabditis sp. 36 PRJEB53466]